MQARNHGYERASYAHASQSAIIFDINCIGVIIANYYSILVDTRASYYSIWGDNSELLKGTVRLASAREGTKVN